MGHRNSLGLAFNPVTGDLWNNENGPYGGDEINIIKPGGNYGWPKVSFGRDYSGPQIVNFAEGMTGPHRVLGSLDRSFGHGVLHRRPLPGLEEQRIGGRHAGRRRAGLSASGADHLQSRTGTKPRGNPCSRI